MNANMRDIEGTYRWMAPELIRVRGELTKETDVYAFAITVIEVLTKGETIPWGSQLPNADVRQHTLSTPYLILQM